MERIDALITWVDGNDPVHIAKRGSYRQEAEHAEADDVHERRWEASDELILCLNSIDRYAPWIARVWIVTDDQQPNLNHCRREFRQKVWIVSHREIFSGYEQYLPTFNSTAIDTMMWRIPDLAPHFISFNDDFFLLNKVVPEDFFDGDKIVVRGKWRKFSNAAYQEHLKVSSYRVAQKNAYTLFGFTPQDYFSPSHVARAMSRDLMKKVIEADWFPLDAALSERFRSPKRISIPSLHAHAAITEGSAEIRSPEDTRHIKVEKCRDASALYLLGAILFAKLTGIKLLCINEVPTIAKRHPWLWRLIRLIIAPDHNERLADPR